MASATSEVAHALASRTYDDLPSDVVHQAKRLILDHLGVGLSGAASESGEIADRFAVNQGGPPEATLLGSGERVSAVNAAFANAISSHSVELDDVDEEALFHHAPPVVAAARAVGEARDASGRSLIAAVVSGCELLTRLSQATNPQLRDRGFHTTPTCGVFGAALSSGLLLGLSEGQLVDALGLAGAQASGLMEMYGPSMQKRFNPGPAARNGVTAALLAEGGFTGADSIIDGQRGFAAAFAGTFDRDRFLDGLEETIPFTVEYKPYSCARPIHNAIDAMLDLRARGLRADEVATVTMFRHPAWAEYHVIAEPRTFHEAQVSLPYSAALALVEGRALPEQYARVGSQPEVMELSKRITVRPDPDLLRGVSCRAVVTTTDGRELTTVVDYPLGSIQRPLTDPDLADKFTSLAKGRLAPAAIGAVIDAVLNLDTIPNVNQLAALLRPQVGALQ